ncbi:MAG: hypothetical protein PWR12_1549 [Eubacteriaceae bacterium]|nr:hypothetical protein [Eubacteriaceae bacterium]MDK2936036.1 hypothetical protein [Eubacteriaceae bacterium]
MKKEELIEIFNNVQERHEEVLSEDFYLDRLQPYANDEGYIDYHKLAMFAHNEALASAKGFMFDVLMELLVDDTDETDETDESKN